VAYPLTLTGSIGIFGGKFSLRGLHDLIGINIEAVQRGKNAGIFTKTRTFKKTEHERFRQHVQEGYDEFISEVAKGRQMAFHAIEAAAQGRVWTGKQALDLGLVDRLGGMDTAVEVIKEKLGFSEDEDIQLVEYPARENSPKPLFKFLETHTTFNFPDEIIQLQDQLGELADLQHEHLFAWWPYQIVVE
jgi:protease-4